jgi:hypothetical protein
MSEMEDPSVVNNSDDDISDIDDDERSQITKEAEDKHVSNEFKDKVLSFIKLDDLIREKNEELKVLKEKKKPCEEFIIRYLDKADSNFVNVIGGKLIKNTAETKGPLGMDIIKDSIVEGMKVEKVTEDEEMTAKMLTTILDLMEKKRPVKKNTNIKRTFIKDKPEKAPKKKNAK